MLRTLIGQTAMLSASHFFVRVLGFCLRIWLSRELGAQAIGLVELAGSAQMLLISPVISGLPSAVSRMCAKSDSQRRVRIVRTGAALALFTGVAVAVLAFFIRVPLAGWLGDLRTLPALLVYLPCIPVLSVSCVLNGYYYGSSRPVPPAVSEILEQIVRFFLCLQLIPYLRSWPAALRAAIPGAAALLGEATSLLLMLLLSCRFLLFAHGCGARREILREMLSLALPLTGMRLVSTLMRTVNTTLIPARLEISGLPASEALTQLGILNGMMMPVLLLPSFITCSLCMVSAPELTRRQAQGKPLRSLITRVLGASLAVGLAAMAAVWLFAPLIAHTLYRQAELLPLLRRCFPLVPVMAMQQVASGLMNGLGLQSKSLRISLFTSFLSLLLLYTLAARPGLRLYGVILSMAAGQIISLALSLRVLRGAAQA